MKPTYSLLTLLFVSFVVAGPVPIRRDSLVARTQAAAAEAAPPSHDAAAAMAPPAEPAMVDVKAEAKKQEEVKAGMLAIGTRQVHVTDRL